MNGDVRDFASYCLAQPECTPAMRQMCEFVLNAWRPTEGDTFYKANVHPGQVVYCRRDDGQLFEMTIPALPDAAGDR